MEVILKQKPVYQLSRSKWMAGILQKIFLSTLTALFITLHGNADSGQNLKKLADQCNQGDKKSCQKLAEIAKEDKNVKVSVAAAQMLSDQSLLADVARTARYLDVIDAAVKQITDQTLLTQIADNPDESSYLRVAAAGNLADTDLAQKVLAEVVKKGYLELSSTAGKSITNQSLLADVAMEASGEEIRTAAVARLTSQEQLGNVANNSKFSETAIAAVQRLTDKNLRNEVAKSSRWFMARTIASYEKDAIVESLSMAGKKGSIEIVISPEEGGKSLRLTIRNILYEDIIVALNPGRNIFEFVQWQFGFIVPESGLVIALKPNESAEKVFSQPEDMMVLSEGSLRISKDTITAIGNIKFKKNIE